MGKTRTPERDLVAVNAPAGVPDYLRGHEDDSLESMKEYRVLPRLKVIQGTSHADLLKIFDVGDIVLSPGNAIVATVDKKRQLSKVPFFMTFSYFFVEFCKWSDIDDKSSATILERSFDASSEIAKRAKDPKKRFEPYGGSGENHPFEARYVEHLNFAGFIYGDDHPFKGEMCVQSFNRGEFGTGTRFINVATLRKAPLWSQVWKASVGFRDKGPKNKWWGIDFSIPEQDDGVQPLISESEVEFFKEASAEMKRLHEARKIIVDHEGTDDRDKEDPPDAESEF